MLGNQAHPPLSVDAAGIQPLSLESFLNGLRNPPVPAYAGDFAAGAMAVTLAEVVTGAL